MFKRSFIIKPFISQPAFLFLSLGCAWLVSSQFSAYYWLRLILSLVITAGILIVLTRHRKRLRSETEALQFYHYLSYLLERLHEGHSINLTMIEAPSRVSEIAAEDTAMTRCLRAVAKALKAGQSLSDAAACAHAYDLDQDALIFFLSLDPVSRTGSQLTAFIRQQHQMIFEKKHILETSEAGIAQQKTEAWLLCLMPYLILYLTAGSSQADIGAAQTTVRQIFYLAGFILSASASFLTGLLLTETSVNKAKHYKFDFLNGPVYAHKIGGIIKKIYDRILPAHYTLNLYQGIKECHRFKQNDPTFDSHPYSSNQRTKQTEQFFNYKGYLCLLSTPVVIVFLILTRNVLFLLIMPLICLAHDIQLRQAKTQVASLCRYAYPQIIHLLTSLILSGFSVYFATRICTDLYNNQLSANNRPVSMAVLQIDLKRMQKRLDMAWSGQAIMTEQAQACLLPEARSAFNLLARYDQSGGRQLMHLIDLQASSCWQMMHLAVKKQLEMRQLKLLLPMMLNLGAVIIISVTPSILTLL